MPIEPRDSVLFREIVHDEAGIALDADKDYLLELRLEPLAHDLGMSGIPELADRLRNGGDQRLQLQVAEALATNETLFFRDFHPFELLRKTVIPSIIDRISGDSPIRIWSVGCASGQEPYSIAMLLHEHFPDLANGKIDISAGDLSPTMIERAQRGSYSQLEVNRGLPVQYLVRYFHKSGEEFRIDDTIRRMVRFDQFNLIDVSPAQAAFDIVFLRNVLIYFDVPTKQAVLEKMRRAMKPDGHLFLGHAETTLNLHEAFERNEIGRAAYYRLQNYCTTSGQD